jgi:DNA-directed RNA polymerase specialized sigma24 family protein
MRGLINRRFTSRLVDQLRHAGGITTDSLARPINGASEGDIALGDTIFGPSSVEQAEARIWLTQILARESQATREVVIRRVLGEPSQAISLELGLDDAATRQRLSRFKRRHAADLVDVA